MFSVGSTDLSERSMASRFFMVLVDIVIVDAMKTTNLSASLTLKSCISEGADKCF